MPEPFDGAWFGHGHFQKFMNMLLWMTKMA
jgi:hypothetical protein